MNGLNYIMKEMSKMEDDEEFEEDLEEIRRDSMEEVRSTNGQISLSKAYRDGHRN